MFKSCFVRTGFSNFKTRRRPSESKRLAFDTLESRYLLATLVVNTVADGPVSDFGELPGSLRQAIFDANVSVGDDTIEFDGSVFTGGTASLIRLTAGQLVVVGNLKIDGSTANNVTITGDAAGNDVTDGDHITDVAASGTALMDDNTRVLSSYGRTGDLTLDGLTITGGRTDSSYGGGGIRFLSSGTLTLENSTVSGNTTGAYAADAYSTVSSAQGGGIRAFQGDIVLVNSDVSRNSTGDGGVGDFQVPSGGWSGGGAGIANSYGNVTLINSTVSGNSTGGGGNGVDVEGGQDGSYQGGFGGNSGGGGGIKTVSGNITLMNSTVSGNSTGNAGDGAAWRSTDTVSAGFGGDGGSGGAGGGILSYYGHISLTNSTVSGNSTGVGGRGGFAYSTGGLGGSGGSGGSGSGISSLKTGMINLVNSTITGNVAGDGGRGAGNTYYSNRIGEDGRDGRSGVYLLSQFRGDDRATTITNSIVARNWGYGLGRDLMTDFEGPLSVSHSLIGVASFNVAFTENVGNQFGGFIDPKLGPLADNGGPTLTHALRNGSPAIDAGDPAFDVNGPDGLSGTDDDVMFDQRGSDFDRVVDGRIDIGAFEFGDVDTTTPKIVSSTIDEGGVLASPDLWQYLRVEFRQDVVISANALSVTNESLGGVPVALNVASFHYHPTRFTATWRLNNGIPLSPGFYTYSLDASLVTSGGLQLDGNGDGTGGDNFVAEHYVALPGDANLDGVVDVSKIEMVDGVPTNVGDASLLLANLGQTSGQLWQDGDFNADGDVDVTQIKFGFNGIQNVGDASILLANLGKSVLPPSATAFASAAAMSVGSATPVVDGGLVLNSSQGMSTKPKDRPANVLPRSIEIDADEHPGKTAMDRIRTEDFPPISSLAGNQQLDEAFATAFGEWE